MSVLRTAKSFQGICFAKSAAQVFRLKTGFPSSSARIHGRNVPGNRSDGSGSCMNKDDLSKRQSTGKNPRKASRIFGGLSGLRTFPRFTIASFLTPDVAQEL